MLEFEPAAAVPLDGSVAHRHSYWPDGKLHLVHHFGINSLLLARQQGEHWTSRFGLRPGLVLRVPAARRPVLARSQSLRAHFPRHLRVDERRLVRSPDSLQRTKRIKVEIKLQDVYSRFAEHSHLAP